MVLIIGVEFKGLLVVKVMSFFLTVASFIGSKAGKF